MNQDINQQPVQSDNKRYNCCSSSSGTFWGGFLILMGLYFLGRELGWFFHDFPFWPIAIIAAGLWMIIGGLRRRK